jgi:hypothetical protein
MDYATGLTFEKTPDFELLKSLVIGAASDARLNIYDGVYDWSAALENHHEKAN